MAHPRPRELFRPRRHRHGRRDSRRGRAAVPAEFPGNLVVDRRAGAVDRPPCRILVRRHQGGLARIDGARRPVTDAGNRLAMWGWDAHQQFGVSVSIPRHPESFVSGGSRAPWAVLVGSRTGSTRCSPSPIMWATRTCSSCPDTSSPRLRPVPLSRVPGVRTRTALRRSRTRPRSSCPCARPPPCSCTRAGARGRHGRRPIVIVTPRRRSSPPESCTGLTGQNALLVSEMNWEQENALLYAGRNDTPGTWRGCGSSRCFPTFLIWCGTTSASSATWCSRPTPPPSRGGIRGFLPDPQDEFPPAPSLAGTAVAIPRGTPYVLTVLAPLRDYPHDAA